MMAKKFRILQEPDSERHAFSTEERRIIEEESKSGSPLYQIAAKIGRSHMGVAKYLHKQSLR
jgi:IS30 family transposase